MAAMDCLHFGVCGGCVSPKPPPYEQELAQKEQRVKDLLSSLSIGEFRPIIPSPEEWYYRNKMEFAFGETREYPFRIGQREAGRFDRIFDLETCFLMSPEAVESVSRARQWAKKYKHTGYNRFSGQGDLRYLVVREGKNTAQRMGVLLSKVEPAGMDEFAEQMKPMFTTCWLGVNDGRGDLARAKDMRLLWGPGTLDERLGSITYRLSPYSFFQTNTRGAERLYGLLLDWAKSIGGGALLDLYCGSGGITLSLAAGFDRVIGVDTNAEAIADAKFNAERNQITNAEFVAEDALKFLEKLPASKLSVQLAAAIVDPPRPGLHPKAMDGLIELNPPALAYVSCNPESLARDLQRLAPLYTIQSVQPVDMFPHTNHVETVCLMEHK